MSSYRIIVFAKAPSAGLAKTRLIPALGAQGAAELAQSMLVHAVEQAITAQLGAVELCVTPDLIDYSWQKFPFYHTVCWSEQGTGDLGSRMAEAARRAIEKSKDDNEFAGVLLMGGDCPDLDAQLLMRASNSLAEAEVCMIPARDGGYVLLGIKRYHAFLFENIAWSTDLVAEQTRQSCARHGLSLVEFAPLTDIDEPADLKQLPRQLQPA